LRPGRIAETPGQHHQNTQSACGLAHLRRHQPTIELDSFGLQLAQARTITILAAVADAGAEVEGREAAAKRKLGERSFCQNATIKQN
jgi:hypothetical protein